MNTLTETVAAYEDAIAKEPSVPPRAADIGTTLADLRRVKDQREELGLADAKLAKQEAALKAQLLAFHESTGLLKLADHGLTVSFNPGAMRTCYDPEKWSDIVKWAASTGHDYIVQRRLTDAKVIALVEEGVALPEGLTLESYIDISIRRK